MGRGFGHNVVAATLLDRLLHHAVAVKIEGNSYRLREHAALMPDNLLPGALEQKPKKRRERPRKGELED